MKILKLKHEDHVNMMHEQKLIQQILTKHSKSSKILKRFSSKF